jgi:ATP/maltotriose-dependent transcriptional regulator MalT
VARQLEHENVFLVTLDDRHERFRYQELFAASERRARSPI